MSPKSASVRPPPPSKSSIATRKSVPRAAKKSNPRSSVAVGTPSSTAALTSPEVFRETRPAGTPTLKSDYNESLPTKLISQTQFDHSGRITVSNSSLAMYDKSNRGGDANECSVTSVEPEKNGSLETDVVDERGDVNACERISPPETVVLPHGPHGQDGRSTGPMPGPESEVSEVKVRNGKKKVVKRTVRVVRRVIKKVPKKVSINGSENQETYVLSNQVIENLNLTNDANKNSNLVCNVMEKSNLVDDIRKTSNMNIDARVLERTHTQRGIYLTVNNALEAHNIKNGDQIIDVDKRYDLNFPSAMEVGKVSIAVESADMSARSEGKEAPVNGKVTFGCESFMASDSSKDSGGFRVENALKENWIADNEKNEDMEAVTDQKVSLVEDICNGFSADHNGTPERKNGSGKDKGKKKVNREVEGDRALFNSGLFMSGELEALERKKRRKTEIFVGGLSKDTKEDDIRDVFKVAGEIVQVRLAMNTKTGKNKGFAFVRFATAADAKNALEKYSKVEICGNQCDAAAVEGDDTIFLGNIDKKWKTEDVVKFLGKSGVDKIEVVTLKTNPRNMENNRGFAFVEFETNKDAQIAFHRLNKDFIGKNPNIKIAWANPLIEPTEEEILKVKSVYAEFLPSSWDEEDVREYFKRFGEIENVVLAKDLVSSKRKDFAFINYSTRDSALACIEVVNRERTENDCYKIKMAVSLANPVPKTKQRKPASDLSTKQLSQENPKMLQDTMKLHECRKKGKPASSNYDVTKVGRRSSTNDELVQILRQQASSKHIPPCTTIAKTSVMEHHFPLSGSKRPFSLVGADQLYLEPKMLPRARMESSYSVSNLSDMSHGVYTTSLPYHHRYHHHHHQEPGHTTESFNWRRIHHSSFQNASRADSYQGNGTSYHRY